MGDAHVESTRLFVTDVGDGPPIVLLHGFPLDGRVWEAVVPLLGHHRVIVPDLRGFGRSDPAGPFSMGQLATDVAALLKVMATGPATIVGLSMGGYVAQEMLRVAPHAVERLILVDTKADADSVEAQNKRNAMAELATERGAEAVAEAMLPNMLAPTAGSAIRERLREIMTSQRRETLAHACIAMRDREDFVNLLMDSTVPIHLIVGEHDAITPPKLLEALHSKRERGHFDVIPNAGHMSPLEQPEAVAAAVLRSTWQEA
jgi:pimeloyl-ACP methyl ester carboxylesterase